MSRMCSLSGKKYLRGNNVSHANNKTKRRFHPNLRSVRLESVALKQTIRCKIAVSTLRSIDAAGGFDAYLIKANAQVLSPHLRRIRKRIALQRQA